MMKIYNNRSELIEGIKGKIENPNTADVQLFFLAPDDTQLVVLKECICGECDYINVNISDGILYGKPCLVDIDRSDLEVGLHYLPVTPNDITLVDIQNLHEWFDGLQTESFIDIEYRDLNIPSFIKDLKINSFKGCKCRHHLSLPTHLIKCIMASGLRTDGNIDLIGTGSFGSLGKDCGEYIEYKNFFNIDKHLEVYKNSLAVNNKVFLEDFVWNKFYNSIEEMVVCLILAKMKVFINSDVTLAIWDFYKEFEI